MVRPLIEAGRVEDPEVAAALRTHVAERGRILRSLEASLACDPRVRAAWLWGSFGRGEADDLSDLDLWLLVSDDAGKGFGAAVRTVCEGAGAVVASGENSSIAPEGGGYLGTLLAGSHGLHHLDLYWQPISKGEPPDGPILFDRRAETPGTTLLPKSPPTGEDAGVDENVGRLAFVWLMTSVAAKTLARHPSSDMGLLAYPRPAFEESAAALGVVDALGEVDWRVPAAPLAKVALLRHVVEKTALLEAAGRARGLSVSPEANPCLRRYLDLVEGILRSAPQ